MAEIKIFCLHCGQHILCDENCRGMQINCPSCNQSFLVPQAPRSATPPPPPSVAPIPKSSPRQKPDKIAETKEWEGVVDVPEGWSTKRTSAAASSTPVLPHNNNPANPTPLQTPVPKKKGVDFFGKIDSRETALNIINWVACIYLAAIVLNFCIGQIEPADLATSIVSAIIYLLLVFFLWKYKSRVAAILLAALLAFGTIYLAMSQANIVVVVLNFLQVFATIRAIEATFKLHGKFSMANSIAPASVRSSQGLLIQPCEHCGGQINYPPESAGLLLSCPHCSQKIFLKHQPDSATASHSNPANMPPRPLNQIATGKANAKQVVSIIGVIIFLIGIILFIGNKSGWFVTFPFAGGITMTVGGILIGATNVKGK
jgi:DNA-directed RNA polymerase subunit RPC12/RpoP